MLSKEELAEFLAILLNFAQANSLSARALANIFGTSAPTMTRWMHRARGTAIQTTKTTYVFRHIADPIRVKLDTLNSYNQTRGIYEALEGFPIGEKVKLLQGALAGRIV